MKKFFLTLLTGFCIFLSGCDRQKPAIFFSSAPIEKETFAPQKMEKTFKVGQKIYFVVYYPKGFPSDCIRLQTISRRRDVPFYGISIEQVRDVSVKKGGMLYCGTFYFYRKNLYYLRVFSPEDWNMPLVQESFMIEDR